MAERKSSYRFSSVGTKKKGENVSFRVYIAKKPLAICIRFFAAVIIISF